jgi:hypothetical protein
VLSEGERKVVAPRMDGRVVVEAPESFREIREAWRDVSLMKGEEKGGPMGVARRAAREGGPMRLGIARGRMRWTVFEVDIELREGGLARKS